MVKYGLYLNYPNGQYKYRFCALDRITFQSECTLKIRIGNYVKCCTL